MQPKYATHELSSSIVIVLPKLFSINVNIIGYSAVSVDL